MAEAYKEHFLEVLDNSFTTCDINRTGIIDKNRLIDFLIAQDPAWQEDKRIREEFEKILCSDSSGLISKDDFISSLLEWFESSLFKKSLENEGENFNDEGSTSSGIEGSVEIASVSSTTSIDDFLFGVNFVLDEQILTNEDMVDEKSSLNESPQRDLRLIKVLEKQITALHHKNGYLEKINYSLNGQVSSLEDSLAKIKKESEEYIKKVDSCNQILELQKLKQEETEEKLNLFIEENKSITMKLTQSEKENSKMKMLVSQVEKQLENESYIKGQLELRFQEVTKKIQTINESHFESQAEFANLKVREKEQEEAWKRAIEENKTLQSQLDFNTLHIQDLKAKIAAASKELSYLKDANMKKKLEPDLSCTSISAANSMVYHEDSFSYDTTVPFGVSLLAELNNGGESDQHECLCLCGKKKITSLTEHNDVPETKYSIQTAEQSTMTSFHEPSNQITSLNIGFKDVGVECSLKAMTLRRKILSKIGFSKRKIDGY